MSQIVYTHQTIVHETGELRETKYVKKEVKDIQEFVILYLKHIALVAKLPASQLRTLLCLADNIEWATGEFTLDSRTMEKLTSCSGLQEQSIRNAVHEMKKRNILSRIKTNWYKLNPDVFWRGSELERQKTFDLTYRWEIR
jgi:hypothetical protein